MQVKKLNQSLGRERKRPGPGIGGAGPWEVQKNRKVKQEKCLGGPLNCKVEKKQRRGAVECRKSLDEVGKKTPEGKGTSRASRDNARLFRTESVPGANRISTKTKKSR